MGIKIKYNKENKEIKDLPTDFLKQTLWEIEDGVGTNMLVPLIKKELERRNETYSREVRPDQTMPLTFG